VGSYTEEAGREIQAEYESHTQAYRAAARAELTALLRAKCDLVKKSYGSSHNREKVKPCGCKVAETLTASETKEVAHVTEPAEDEVKVAQATTGSGTRHGNVKQNSKRRRPNRGSVSRYKSQREEDEDGPNRDTSLGRSKRDKVARARSRDYSYLLIIHPTLPMQVRAIELNSGVLIPSMWKYKNLVDLRRVVARLPYLTAAARARIQCEPGEYTQLLRYLGVAEERREYDGEDHHILRPGIYLQEQRTAWHRGLMGRTEIVWPSQAWIQFDNLKVAREY
jgi:hypothetical protein